MGGWSLLVGLAAAWGTRLNEAEAGILLPAPPLYAELDLQLGARLAVPGAVATAVVWFGPGLAGRLRWPLLLGASALAALGWALALAYAGAPGIVAPLERSTEYLAVAELVRSPGDFLAGFTAQLDIYSVHVRGHPPGNVLLLWALAQIGLGGAWPAALLIVAAGASAVPAVLVATQELAGQDRARAVAPYLVLAPAAVWVASSADALFMGIGAWFVALAVMAIRRRGLPALGLSLVAGLVLGIGLLFSYGLILLAAIPLAVAVALGGVRRILLVGACAGLVLLVTGLAGFWWPEGLLATREQYLEGIAARRPYEFFLLANLGALAIALGPAAATGLTRLRDRRLWLLVGGACVAVAAADLSGMSKGEVERIWLPFMPWLLVACAALPRGRPAHAWLAAQATCGLAIQALLRTTW